MRQTPAQVRESDWGEPWVDDAPSTSARLSPEAAPDGWTAPSPTASARSPSELRRRRVRSGRDRLGAPPARV